MANPSEKDKQVRRIILLEGSANLLILICKALVGLSTGSMAILADAAHSLTDLMNNIVAWIVMRFSSLPADREHPYGHRKFETLAAVPEYRLNVLRSCCLDTVLVVLCSEFRGLWSIQQPY